MNFFKSVFATVVGIFLFMLLSFFLLIGLGAVLGSGEDKVKLKDNSVKVLSCAWVMARW